MQVRPDDPERPWADEGVFEVDPGVYRIPLPMPNDGLRAVNVYAIEDGDGLTLVDGGVAVMESREALDRAMAVLDRPLAAIGGFLVTHLHRDHYSQALALREEFGHRVSIGIGERASIEIMAEVRADPSIYPLRTQEALLHRYGAHELAATIRRALYDDGSRPGSIETHRPIEFPKNVFPDVWLGEHDVTVGERTLRPVHTPGHTQGHMVFADREGGVLFAGDHILPTITPSIGFEPAPGALPLGDYLRSLDRVRRMPDARLFPAHGFVRASVHERIDELLLHHEQRLDASAHAVERGALTAQEVASVLRWTPKLRRFDEMDLLNQMLAVLETGAHLDLLVTQGRLVSRVVDEVMLFEAG
jgi:glyoxylase-like metal-dependent hydrolase (beta-lactamase superfamily II)